jgi:radial spoke head protein 4/6
MKSHTKSEKMSNGEIKSNQNSCASHSQMESSQEEGSSLSFTKDLQNAKMLLMQCGPSGDSLFNHLSNVVAKVIDERPTKVVEYFEQFSEQLRFETFRMNENLLEEGYKEPERLALAQKLLPSLIESSKISVKKDEEDEPLEESLEEHDDDEEVTYNLPISNDLSELQFYWSLLGIGLHREEIFMLQLSMKKITADSSFKTSRFWGKIFGLKNDYYIFECTPTDAAHERRMVSLTFIFCFYH